MGKTNRKSGQVVDSRGDVFTLPLTVVARSADPDAPLPGTGVIWMSDGTGSGDAGDIMAKTNVAGTVKLTKMVDHSAGA